MLTGLWVLCSQYLKYLPHCTTQLACEAFQRKEGREEGRGEERKEKKERKEGRKEERVSHEQDKLSLWGGGSHAL